MAKPIMGTTAGATTTRIIFSNDANSAGGTIAMGTLLPCVRDIYTRFDMSVYFWINTVHRSLTLLLRVCVSY